MQGNDRHRHLNTKRGIYYLETLETVGDESEMSERCPEVRMLVAGDESIDICRINGKICLLESRDECDIYNEYLEELEQARLLLGIG